MGSGRIPRKSDSGGVAHIVRTFCRQLLLPNHRLTVAILWNGKLDVELAARQMHEVHTDENKRNSISVETTRFVLMDCTAVTAGQSLNTKLATLYNVGLITLAEYPNASLWVNFDASDLASALDVAVRSIAGASEATRLHGAAFYLCNSLDFYFWQMGVAFERRTCRECHGQHTSTEAIGPSHRHSQLNDGDKCTRC